MKKYLFASIILALIVVLSFSIICFASNDDVIDDSFEIYTYEEFQKKVISVCNADEVNPLDLDFSGYGKRQMGIYLPEGIDIDDITEICLYPSYIAVGFEYDDDYIQLQFYHTSYGESRIYTTARERGQALTSDSGITVYNYVGLGAEYYYWIDDDETYRLYVNSVLDRGKYLSLCSAVYHSFGEAYKLTAEPSDSKIKLSWDEIVEDETYTVYWKRSGSDEWKVAGITSKHKVNITGLKSGVSYDFKIEATGVESETVTVTAE